LLSKRKAATREQLVGATEALISEGGLAAVTTQSVARRGGCAEGTIYRHFDSRDELIVATLRERFRGEFDHASELLRASVGKADVETNLAAFLSLMVPLYANVAPALGMLAADPCLAAKNAEAVRADGRGPRNLAEQIEKYFRAEQRLGRVAPDADIKAAGGLLVSLAFYRALVLHLMREDPVALSDRALVTSVAGILAKGLGATSTPTKTAAAPKKRAVRSGKSTSAKR
jgi:AcrR family transcriptional regulator